MRDEAIKRLRKTLPEFLTVQQYCGVTKRCIASAYNDLRNKPGLGVKVGPYTRFVRDVMLGEMARAPQPWLPQKDRLTAPTKETPAKSSTRSQRQQPVAARRKHDPEVRA